MTNARLFSLKLDAPRAQALDRIFSANGVLAQNMQGYRVRAAQREMAGAIAAAMHAHPEQAASEEPTDQSGNGTALLVEAGTGTGKTFAYLVPAMLWGGKVILSTGTKHLQDQLFARDIPALRRALAMPLSVAMLKGRANYVCHYYLQRTLQDAGALSHRDAAHVRAIIRFSKTSQSGDKSELAQVPESAPIWGRVTSTRENCLNQECPHLKDCFVMHARRKAQQADLVVVNHALFFADMMLRESGVQELLPSANTVIFDEAHQLPDTATLFFGETVRSYQWVELARDVRIEGLTHARDGADWTALCAALETAARDLRLAFDERAAKYAFAQLDADHPLHAALAALDAPLDALTAALEAHAPRAETLGQCLRRTHELRAALARFRAPYPVLSTAPSAAPDRVRWVEVFAQSVHLHTTPLSITAFFEKQRATAPRAWIFTSATLSVKGDFTHYATQMGLPAYLPLSVQSPFDYTQQALLYVPRGLPAPASPAFSEAMLNAVLPVIKASGGRAFVLCTTLRAVERLSAQLREALHARDWDFPLLIQGDASRTELLKRFQQAGNAILVGSQSFWEGVDVRGKALSLVIIDKLPFAPPDDPVLAARLDALAQQGQDPFMAYQLPQAVIALKQGAGRLIRTETDSGVLMVCDSRLVEKPYGRRFWQSLPPFARTRDLEACQRFLNKALNIHDAPL
ncbi:Putative ATP-dependent helicase dinG [Candidatus Glomeribacter gigasporarum BEG34]|uniref:Putative ATP-dependent helicase dinG n=1 Tax=Candidatus Glomeribacter gigasporarum BEG34 TaxID=1070319 RepID=G2J7R3_9BURK|nr:ATP-dependent DNA helicase [Candidatus Glomeribacter gigasporarum]CCD28808.1 Putative ATP-dependent helicase dinG [Candidatus Glomeribacter gigasporarum BEG34]